MRCSRALPLVLLLLAGCAPGREPLPAPGAPAQVAGVDWEQAARVEVVLSDFAFAPARLELEEGRPYRLHLENRGSGGHNFSAPDFFRAAALRDDAVSAEARERGGTIELAQGETKDAWLLPLEAGRFPLECTHFLHPTFGMTGEIVVN